MNVAFNGSWSVPAPNDFLDTCESIVNNDNLYNSFKTNKLFCNYIGNDVRSYEHGLELLNNISKDILNDISKYKINDKIGNPPLHHYENIGHISTGTLTFLSYLSKIKNIFSDIHDFNICEIGSGYGGQASVFLTHGINHYTCIDEIRCLKLANRYIADLGYENVSYYDSSNIEIQSYDLIISNWCLSELDDIGIDFYIENVISKSMNCYFDMNILVNERKNRLIKRLNEYFYDVNIIVDPFRLRENNFTIICKNNKTK